jgi:hypothetical protein
MDLISTAMRSFRSFHFFCGSSFIKSRSCPQDGASADPLAPIHGDGEASDPLAMLRELSLGVAHQIGPHETIQGVVPVALLPRLYPSKTPRGSCRIRLAYSVGLAVPILGGLLCHP